MRKSVRLAACLVAGLMMSGCFGQFALTRKLYNWNASVGDKWANELVYLIAAHLIPVYGIAGLADALIINSIEFWTGENPVHSASAAQPKHFALGNGSEGVMTRKGDQVIFEEFRDGKQVSRLNIQRQGGLTVATNEQGVAVLRSQTLPDGSIVVTNATSEQVAFFPAEQIRQQVAKATSQAN